MPLLNREAADVLRDELERIGYPKALYSFAKKNTELRILSYDQIHVINLKGLSYHVTKKAVERLSDINAYRLKHANKRPSTQIDIEDVIKESKK